ncbi:MAG: bifunctional diaminohydroxyphosphoribosylaminopyrimidine deaminase/5-amino-6-(5-phosphoribosylamino)uracil reductase RibD [Pseudomonadota bacterium]
MNTLAEHYLKQALALAELRRGFCAPNPCVGAVLVKDERIIASGTHWASGFPHAEADALNKIDARLARDATLYVTLQPCCHSAKKTPPCSQLLIEKGIAKVVYGFQDPNPAVGDHADKQLQQAGIICIQQSLPEINHFYASYQFWWQHQRPFVTAKLAISLDGKIAGEHGQCIQLTGETAQQFTHQQRQRADAILTTAKTIFRDNPLLNVRTDGKLLAKPLAILDSELRLSGTENIFNSAKKIILFHKANLPVTTLTKYNRDNVRLISVKQDSQGLNLFDVLKKLGQEGCHDLWVEAGGHCFQTLAQNQLLQCAFIYVAPQWLGQEAQTAFSNPNVFLGANTAPPHLLGSDVCFKFNWSEK